MSPLRNELPEKSLKHRKRNQKSPDSTTKFSLPQEPFRHVRGIFKGNVLHPKVQSLTSLEVESWALGPNRPDAVRPHRIRFKKLLDQNLGRIIMFSLSPKNVSSKMFHHEPETLKKKLMTFYRLLHDCTSTNC